VGVDADELRAAGTVVPERVWRVRWDDDDVARSGSEALDAGPEGEVSLDDDPGLVVGVAVQARSLAGLALVEDQRDGGAVVFALRFAVRACRS
jgi:hypothetical protein